MDNHLLWIRKIITSCDKFSVDIDIITEESRETIEAILNQVVDGSHFKKWELDEKRSYQPGVSKAHYKMEYDSNVNKGSNYILLDILFEKPHYSKTSNTAIFLLKPKSRNMSAWP